VREDRSGTGETQVVPLKNATSRGPGQAGSEAKDGADRGY